MKTVNCEGVEYLAHEAEGGASRWIIPLAKHYCCGQGLDIGYSKYEWKMPNAFGIEPSESPLYDAMNLPDIEIINDNPEITKWDYIFSSHCLEHVKENWYNVLDYWLSKIRVGGILFLYLPHASQRYWQPRNNRKHIHSFNGDEIGEYLRGLGHQVFVSGIDANHSFCVICEKVGKEPEFGSKEYYDVKAKVIADEREIYCQERSISYVREGNNVIYNEPSSYITADFNGKYDGMPTFYQQNEVDIEQKISIAEEQMIVDCYKVYVSKGNPICSFETFRNKLINIGK